MRHQHSGRRGRSDSNSPGDPAEATDAADWFAGRLPDAWFTGPPRVSVDREEITVVGRLAEPDGEGPGADARGAGRAARFREETRADRVVIADEAQRRYGRTVSWGVEVGDERVPFTHLAVPVMTRLRQPERQVLDTLVDAGVARSRADAVAWSVKLVGEHAQEWLAELRSAMGAVEDLRAQGPQL